MPFVEPENGKIMFDIWELDTLAYHEFLLTVDEDVKEVIVEKMATGHYQIFLYDRNVPREVQFLHVVNLEPKRGTWEIIWFIIKHYFF